MLVILGASLLILLWMSTPSYVGKLIYLIITWPDLSYAVGVVGQFMNAPRDAYLHAIFRNLRYLKAHHGRGLFYPR